MNGASSRAMLRLTSATWRTSSLPRKMATTNGILDMNFNGLTVVPEGGRSWEDIIIDIFMAMIRKRKCKCYLRLATRVPAQGVPAGMVVLPSGKDESAAYEPMMRRFCDNLQRHLLPGKHALFNDHSIFSNEQIWLREYAVHVSSRGRTKYNLKIEIECNGEILIAKRYVWRLSLTLGVRLSHTYVNIAQEATPATRPQDSIPPADTRHKIPPKLHSQPAYKAPCGFRRILANQTPISVLGDGWGYYSRLKEWNQWQSRERCAKNK